MNHHACLIEIRTEELPPKALQSLLSSFQHQVVQQLQQAHFAMDSVQVYGSPRRLALYFSGLAERQPEQRVERKGPMIDLAYDADGQPSPALLGFVKSCQTTLEQLTEIDTPKGKALVYRNTIPGQSIQTVLPTIVHTALSNLPIPKMMRWGDHLEAFVRPVHSIILLYGTDVIASSLFGIKANRLTVGHRFHAPKEISIHKPEDYVEQLRKAKVLVDIEERREHIVQAVYRVAATQNATAITPKELIDEVTQLVEWPVALLCRFEERFLTVPQEALILAMQTHQKCFPLVDAQNKLLPYFIVISNIESKAPEQVIEGNERVVRARLSDAQFFYESDLKKPLLDYLPALQKVTFQAKLGSIGAKVNRLVTLSHHFLEHRQLPEVQHTQEVERAALLCKSDLLSAMVNEFPELQGIMGHYYAQQQGESAKVAMAIQEHYLPRFSGDILPKSIIGQTLALADKLDTLVGIFAIGEKPTGSKDPFALRRQAIGILRIMTEHSENITAWAGDLEALIDITLHTYSTTLSIDTDKTKAEVLAFFRERIRPFYQDRGIATGVIDAAMAATVSFNPISIDQRINAVQVFIKLPAAAALAEANKRVYNLLNKNNALTSELSFNEALLVEPAEQHLFNAIHLKIIADQVLEHAQDYVDLLCGLADLQTPLDQFFTDVMVMSDDIVLRTNRLALLKMIRELFVTVADIRLL